MVEVAIQGPAAAVQTVVDGRADIVFEKSVMLEKPVREGQLRPIATMGYARAPYFPDLPTTVELGMRDLTSYAWTGVVAPAGTPREIVQVLNQSIRTVMTEIESQATFIRYGSKIE